MARSRRPRRVVPSACSTVFCACRASPAPPMPRRRPARTRDAGRQLSVWQGVERVCVDQHAARLVERANHVLAQRVVHPRLAAHRRVDLQGRRAGRGHTGVLGASLHHASAACARARWPLVSGPATSAPGTGTATCDMTVVGTWMKCTPRWYAAAAKPHMSPTTPPPSAMKVVLRSSLAAGGRRPGRRRRRQRLGACARRPAGPATGAAACAA